MTKRWLAIFLLAALLAACASRGTQAVVQEAEADEALPELVYPRVEIFYESEPQLTVVDGGGSSWRGMAGGFGPVAALVALGAHVVSEATAPARVYERSKAFRAAVEEDGGAKLYEAYAEELARVLRAREREVKLTPIARPQGPGPRKLSVPGIALTPGFTALILRLSNGYGAPDLTSSYRPIVQVELQIQDDQGRYQTHNNFGSNYGEPTYFTFETLLKEHRAAYQGLQTALFKTVPWIADAHFPAR